MTMPHIPDITPTIQFTRHEAVTLLLSSIALEEIGISHMLNAEGEKIQYVLKQNPSVHDLFRMNRFTERLLRKLIHQEMLLQEKLENVIEMCHRCDAEDSEEDGEFEE